MNCLTIMIILFYHHLGDALYIQVTLLLANRHTIRLLNITLHRQYCMLPMLKPGIDQNYLSLLQAALLKKNRGLDTPASAVDSVKIAAEGDSMFAIYET